MTTATVTEAEAATTNGCGPCSHAEAHGWWGATLGKARTHCRSCHRSWRSLREAHCAGCCRHFADPAAFDAHRVDGQCVAPETVTRRDGQPRYKVLDGPYGTTYDLIGRAPDPALLARLRGLSSPP